MNKERTLSPLAAFIFKSIFNRKVKGASPSEVELCREIALLIQAEYEVEVKRGSEGDIIFCREQNENL